MTVALYRGLAVYSDARVIAKLYFNVRGGGGISCDLSEGGHIAMISFSARQFSSQEDR